MIDFSERELYLDLDDKLDKIDDNIHNNLLSTIENIFELLKINNTIEINTSLENAYLFLDTKFLGDYYTMYSDEKSGEYKTNYGFFSKNLNNRENVVKSLEFPKHGYCFYFNNLKYNLLPDKENTLIIFLDKYVPNFIFPSSIISNNIINNNDILKIKESIKYVYIVIKIPSKNYNSLDFRSDNINKVLEKYILFVIETNSNRFEWNLIIFTYYPCGEILTSLLFFLKKFFEKVYLSYTQINLASPYISIVCKNRKNMKESDKNNIINTCKYFNIKSTKTKIKIYRESTLFNHLFKKPALFYEIFDLYNFRLLSETFLTLKKFNISHNSYFDEILKNFKSQSEQLLENIVGTDIATTPFYFDNSSNYKKILKIYKMFQIIKLSHGITFKINVKNISTDIDIEIFDVCNNNFFIENNLNYYIDFEFKDSIDKFTKAYNYSIDTTPKNNYNAALISYKNIRSVYNNIDSDKLNKIIIKIDITDLSELKYIQLLSSYFNLKTIYAPYINQLNNNYIYIIFSQRVYDTKNNKMLDIETVLYEYIINNKILLLYYTKLFGYDKFVKQYVKYLTSNL